MIKSIKLISHALFLTLLLANASNAENVYKNQIQISPYNLIFTKIKINEKEVLALIDTGSFRTLELSSTLAEELKIPLNETTKVGRRYEGKDFYLKSGKIDSLNIGNYQKQNVGIDVIEGDIENIAKQVNTNFEAILGWGFVSQFFTSLDYKNLSMEFSDTPLIMGKSKLSLDYSVINNAPIVKGVLDNQPVDLLFDTGAPMSNLDLSLAGVSKNEKVLKELSIQNNKFSLEWRAKDLTPIKKSLNCGGVIGNNLLKDYDVYFDIRNKTIQLY